MDQETLRRRLMATFLGELDEHAQALNRDLLAIENDPAEGRAELLISLFRSVHSLKGASRSVNVQPIETACHRLESLLSAVRDGLRPLSPEIVQLLYTSVDALKDSGERLRTHGVLEVSVEEGSGAPLEALLPALDDALRRTDGVPAPASRPETSPSPAPEPVAQPRQDQFVRVAVDKLDALLVGSGELLVTRRRAAATQREVVQLHDDIRQWRSEWRRLEQPLRTLLTSQTRLLPKRAAVAFERTGGHLKALERRVEQLAVRMAAENHGLEWAAASLEDDIRGVRMFPFSHASEGLERTVRDLTHGSAKQIDLVIEGRDVQVGRLVLERLKDPLLHLVRNAVDHGIETRDERLALGKPGRGNVTVTAGLRGGGVEIVVADDGRGLDMAAIREHAQRRHMKVPKDDRAASRLIFLPGFSTARLITALSGRGVGLDVVKHRVESLHGHVDVAFEPGRGTRVVINVPLTVVTIRALLFGAAGHVFALPVASVRRLARVGAGDIASTGGREVLLSEGAPIPLVSLIDLLGIRGGMPRSAAGKTPLVIVALGTTQVALVVDELIAEDEILVKSLGPRLLRVRHFAGATILPSGRVALILNTADVVHSALGLAPGRALTAARAETAIERKRRLLVVDDSVTTRSLEKSILEAAGYEVLVAVDGREAWRLLQDAGADLVVADVQMPRMDGFALCDAIRGSTRFRELPVVLVTALESDTDKARGLEVGADAYLPKSAFDQPQLLETIAHLL
jgi:two-component system, chemotaxis family, sensor kinase CheA